MNITRICPQCHKNTIYPLQFRLGQAYHCPNCDSIITTPRWFGIMTVCFLLLLFFVCLYLDGDFMSVVVLLGIYLFFEPQINAMIAPLQIKK